MNCSSASTIFALVNIVLIFALIALSQDVAQAQRFPQDILRTPKQSSTTATASNPSSSLPVQLPPELAQFTPEQLQQLAQLRAMQIQQQQQQQQNRQSTQEQSNVRHSDARAQNSPQTQPQPSVRSNVDDFTSSSNDRSGAGSDSLSDLSRNDAPASATATGTAATTGGETESAGAPTPTFEVNWNKCPQLEPSESEKAKKTQVITKCLQSAPIPTNLTRENVEAHREQIATCALKDEGWFDAAGNYRYDKAELEIRSKKLEPQIEVQVLKFHVACRNEAAKKFPREQKMLIDQVQFYQACMDYYISIACEIEVSVDSAR